MIRQIQIQTHISILRDRTRCGANRIPSVLRSMYQRVIRFGLISLHAVACGRVNIRKMGKEWTASKVKRNVRVVLLVQIAFLVPCGGLIESNTTICDCKHNAMDANIVGSYIALLYIKLCISRD